MGTTLPLLLKVSSNNSVYLLVIYSVVSERKYKTIWYHQNGNVTVYITEFWGYTGFRYSFNLEHK